MELDFSTLQTGFPNPICHPTSSITVLFGRAVVGDMQICKLAMQISDILLLTAGPDCCVNSTTSHLCFRYRRKRFSMSEVESYLF